MRFSADPADLAWTEDGMYELVSEWLLVNVVEHAPDAISEFVASFAGSILRLILLKT